MGNHPIAFYPDPDVRETAKKLTAKAKFTETLNAWFRLLKNGGGRMFVPGFGEWEFTRVKDGK